MKIVTDHIRKLPFAILLMLVVVGCNKKNKDLHPHLMEDKVSSRHSLTPVIDSIDQDIKNGDYGLVDRFMVIQHEELLADFKYSQDYETIAQKYDTTNHQYNYDHPNWHPYYRNTDLHTLQSVTKSVNSILLGIAFDLYPDFNVNTKVMPLFSDYAPEIQENRKNDITIEDLLTMRAGLQWKEGEYTDLSDDCIAMEASTDWITYVMDKPTDTIPGTHFKYNSGASVLLGKIVNIITGKKADQWAEEKLFGPLGITNYYWKKTPAGEIDTEGGLYLRAEDLAKIGALYLNRGKWKNEQIVSEPWVEASIQPVVNEIAPEKLTNIGYGYQWWVPYHINGKTKIFLGNGYGGQLLMVAPEYDLIVLFNGWNIHEPPKKHTWNVLKDRLFPVLERHN